MSRSGPILIVGKSGRVAQDLAAEAARRGLAARAIGRPELDIEDADAIARVVAAERPCAIVNAAAVGMVDEAERDHARAFALNRDGAARLAAAAARDDIPFLHISTDFVFDGGKQAPYREDDAPAPLNTYGQSKLAGEQAVRDAHPSAFVFRTAWVYGPHGNNFLTAMLRLAATQDSVRVVADQVGSPTAGPIWRALLDIAPRLAAGFQASPGVYHLAGSGGTSWRAWRTPFSPAGPGATIAFRASSRLPWRIGRARRGARIFGARLWQGRARLRHPIAALGGLGRALSRRASPRNGDSRGPSWPSGHIWPGFANGSKRRRRSSRTIRRRSSPGLRSVAAASPSRRT